LAAKGITINTGTTLNGRALAQTNITLNTNIVTVSGGAKMYQIGRVENVRQKLE
jgi:hypothetical protein